MSNALNPNALTTLAEVKGELGIACDDVEHDRQIRRRINAVSTTIERFLSRELRYEAGRVETIRSYGGVRVRVRKPPVVTLTLVENVSLSGPLLVDPIELVDVIVEDEGETGILYRVSGWPDTAAHTCSIARDPLPGTEGPGVRVTYDGGYVLPQQACDDDSLERSLPEDIEEAAIMAVVSSWTRRGGDIAIKSERSLSGSVTFDLDKATGLPAAVVSMLKPHRILGQGAW